MEVSLLLIKEIVKLFSIMIMGYSVVKLNLMTSKESKSLSVLLIYIITPCVILNAFQVKYTPEIKHGLIIAFIAAILIHILFLLLAKVLTPILHLNTIERATLIYPNAGNLVIPLVQALLGDEYIIYTSAFITIQLILFWTHCKSMICEEKKLEWKKIISNINIISILIGMFLFITQTMLPSDVQDVVSRMGNMTGPVGMLLAGMIIAEVPLKSVFTTKRNYLASMLRLIICPLATLVLMKFMLLFIDLEDIKNIFLVTLLASTAPAAATITSMAQLYDKNASYASSLYVLTTLLSILTMPIIVGLFELFL